MTFPCSSMFFPGRLSWMDFGFCQSLFFGISWDDHDISVFGTIYMRYDIYPLVYTEPSQHLQNKTNLFIVNDVWVFFGGGVYVCMTFGHFIFVYNVLIMCTTHDLLLFSSLTYWLLFLRNSSSSSFYAVFFAGLTRWSQRLCTYPSLRSIVFLRKCFYRNTAGYMIKAAEGGSS